MKTKYDEMFKTLKKIALNFKEESKEYRAIEKASWALHYIIQNKNIVDFDNFIKNSPKLIAKQQMSFLESIGLKNNSLMKKSLDEIGQDFKETRKRIKEIEKNALEKINKNPPDDVA